MNWADLLVLLVLGAAVFFAARSALRARRNGGCAGCSCGSCREDQRQKCGRNHRRG